MQDDPGIDRELSEEPEPPPRSENGGRIGIWIAIAILVLVFAGGEAGRSALLAGSNIFIFGFAVLALAAFIWLVLLRKPLRARRMMKKRDARLLREAAQRGRKSIT